MEGQKESTITQINDGFPSKERSGTMDRKQFLKVLGGAALTTSLLAACSKNSMTGVSGTTAHLGSGDIGILNYAYALEQLEAAFYIKVTSSPYSGMTSAEQQILADLKAHETAHRDFLKAALSAKAIIDLEFNFSSIDFSNRTNVLTAARTFEDLGVAAYNGAGKLIQSSDYLLVAGKIVSVEARHAAAIRDLLQPKTAYFAGDDVIDANGQDGALTPLKVLADASAYVKTNIDASQLPTG